MVLKKIKQFFIYVVGTRFFKSEYDKVHFYYSLSSFIMSVIGIVFWLVILVLCSLLVYARINYPEKFQQLYDVPSRNQNSGYNSDWFNDDVYIVRDFFG